MTLLDMPDIDDGQLRLESPANIFILGMEWAVFCLHLRSGRAFGMKVHTSNIQRLRALCERDYRLHLAWIINDDWWSIEVAAL